ncbi:MULTISPECIES: RCC1 domain-containing protein [Pseudomonas]|uniref:Uncharacterized protein n=1 Tax=Pseudomonas fluorescens TaxID=294 RepID=A0A5E6W7S0_PSEFL|nr:MULTISPECIES: hypothetical protein [Pseudomonas]VVN24765.1 hypothetical protein PS652_04516 [Pseudomonas fluorescens]
MNQDSPFPAVTPLLPDEDPSPWYLRVEQIQSIVNSHVRIPYMTELFDHPDGLDGGITAAVLQTNPNGLLVLVEPYLQMAPGDEVRVFWGDPEQAATPVPYVVQRDDLNKLLYLYVPAQNIPNGVAQVWFQVKALSGDEADSGRLLLKTKRALPGGPDPRPDLEGHYGLVPPDVPVELIDEEYARRGVEVYIFPWLNMAVRDTVRLSWGGVIVGHEVQAQEVGKLIEIVVDYDTIIEAGDSDELAVVYQLLDEVGNFSDGWSLHSHAQVEAGGFRLDPPLIAEADDEGYVDLAQLEGADVTVQVYASRATGFAVNDRIQVKWRGFTEEGSGIAPFEPEPFILTRLPHLAPFSIPNAVVAAIAQGMAFVSYELDKGVGGVIPSKRTTVGVRGVNLGLAAPTVAEAVEQHLPADLPRAHVIVPAYAGMAVGQRVVVVWHGIRADQRPYLHEAHRLISNNNQLGQPLVVEVKADHIALLDGGTLEVFYRVIYSSGQYQESQRLGLYVGEAVAELAAPSVDDVDNGAWDPEGRLVATVRIFLYDGMRQGQKLVLAWGSYTDEITVPEVVPEVVFTVPVSEILPSLGDEVQISYSVVEDNQRPRYSDTLTLYIGEAGLRFPAPGIVEAEGDGLDPINVPSGATITIGVEAGLRVNDVVTVYWRGAEGAGSVSKSRTVRTDEVGEVYRETIEREVVLLNQEGSVTLDYTVERDGEVFESAVRGFNVGKLIASGIPKVMGARSGSGGVDWGYSMKRLLVAVDTVSLQPIEARWRYDGDTEPQVGMHFLDQAPSRLLYVWTETAGSLTLVNRSNIGANPYSYTAITDSGSMIAWGAPLNGGVLSPVAAQVRDAVAVVGGDWAMVARRANGALVTWGSNPLSLSGNFTQAIGTYYGMAALTAQRKIQAWGRDLPPAPIVALTDVVELYGGRASFAARRASGHVVGWGYYGDVPADIAQLTDIVDVCANGLAFAALRRTGQVRAWGAADYGGILPEDIARLTDVVRVAAAGHGFAVLRANGQVQSWGIGLPVELVPINDFIDIRGAGVAFAAVRSDGSVKAWGRVAGGILPDEIASLKNIVQLVASLGAFTVLLSDGQVRSWGAAHLGGAIPPTLVGQLVNVQAVYANFFGFAALTADKRVVAWGNSLYGGNAPPSLNGQLTYSTPASQAQLSQLSEQAVQETPQPT